MFIIITTITIITTIICITFLPHFDKPYSVNQSCFSSFFLTDILALFNARIPIQAPG
jgi:hypothetical protein